MAIVGMLTGVVALCALWSGDRPRQQECLGFLLIAAFLIYISSLPRIDGHTTRWVYVLTTALALFVFSEDRRVSALQFFSAIFAASLIPAIVASLWVITGLPVIFEAIPHANSAMADAGAQYISIPGALLLASNGTSLPWGGMLFRICGMYDEPGMVGTIGAMLLAANRFRINGLVSAVIFIGGVLSFSLAFVLLSAVAISYRLMTERSFKDAAALMVVFAAGLLTTGVIDFGSSTQSTAAVQITGGQAIVATELRQTEHLDNRSLPGMDALVTEFWASDTDALAFGLGSDASVVRGGVSQVIDRIFTDYGLIGFALYTMGFASLMAAFFARTKDHRWVAIFALLFVLSAYQRPVIWLPYALTILVCGLSSVSRQKWAPAA